MKIIISPYSQKMRNNKENPKNYPWWPELIGLLKGHTIIQIGVKGEKQLVKDFRTNLPFKEVKNLLNECDFWISVDSFLPHLARFAGKTGVVLWGPSDPIIFGYEDNLNILKDRSVLRKDQFEIWEKQEFNPDIFVKAKEVYEIVKKKYALG